MQGAVASVSHRQGRALPPWEVGRPGGAFPKVSSRSPWVSLAPALAGVSLLRAEGERRRQLAQGPRPYPQGLDPPALEPPTSPLMGHISPLPQGHLLSIPPPSDYLFLPPSPMQLILLSSGYRRHFWVLLWT